VQLEGHGGDVLAGVVLGRILGARGRAFNRLFELLDRHTLGLFDPLPDVLRGDQIQVRIKQSLQLRPADILDTVPTKLVFQHLIVDLYQVHRRPGT
jgi:hypothetical protein